MKLFISVALAVLLLPRAAVAKETPNDRYIPVFDLIHEADTLSEGNHAKQAEAKYAEAQTALKKFQADFPDWQTNIVSFRLNYLGSKLKTSAPAEPPAEAAAKIATPAEPSSAEQVRILQGQLQAAQTDKAALQDQVKALQAGQAAMVEAGQFAQAQEQIKELQKENHLLRIGIEQGQTGSIQLTNSVAMAQLRQSLADLNQKLQEQADLAAKLTLEKEALQKELDAKPAAPAAKELARTRQSLAALKRKHSIQTDAAIIVISEANLKIARMAKAYTNLTAQNQKLQTQYDSLAGNARFVFEGLKRENETLNKELAEARKKIIPVIRSSDINAPEDAELLQSQLAALRAKVNVLEAQPIPFTPEELALFRRPETAALASGGGAGDKTTKSKLPAEAAGLIAEARQLFTQHQYNEAQAKYMEVLKLDPENVYTLANLATIELDMDKRDDAGKHVLQALAINPKDGFSLGVLGNLRFREGKYDQALDALGRAAQINPDNAEIQNFLGVTLSQKGQRIPAETALRKAIQIDPEYAGAHHNLAVIYATQNPPQTGLAGWHYNKALAAGQPRNPELEKMLNGSGEKPADAKP